jgi:hypothetical protein
MENATESQPTRSWTSRRDEKKRGCLKIWAETEISEDPAVIERLSDRSYGATIDRAFLFRVLAFEWNCQQSIVQ